MFRNKTKDNRLNLKLCIGIWQVNAEVWKLIVWGGELFQTDLKRRKMNRLGASLGEATQLYSLLDLGSCFFGYHC